MRRIGFLFATVAVTLALAGCGGGSKGGAPAPGATSLVALADSARKSAEATSGRFTFSMDMSMPGLADGLAFTGSGSFDGATGKSEMTLDMSSLVELMKGMAGALGGDQAMGGDLDADDFKIEAVLDGLDMYVRAPFIGDQLPGGKEWMKVDLRQAAQQIPGLELDQLTQFASNGPQSSLDYLRAVSGEIEVVGDEELRGVPTTRYRTTIDLTKYAQLAPAGQREQVDSMLDQMVGQTGIERIPVDVWVGGDGLVRKLALQLAITEPGSGQSMSAGVTFELFDYGKPVVITLPLPEDTADVTSLARP